MTENYKLMITKLRLGGMGYRAIAKRLNLKRDTVRDFCKCHSLDGVSDVVELNYAEMLNRRLICPCCGRKIRNPRPNKKFCSDRCRYKYNKQIKI